MSQVGSQAHDYDTSYSLHSSFSRYLPIKFTDRTFHSCAVPAPVLWSSRLYHSIGEAQLRHVAVPLAFITGFAAPPVVGLAWGDPVGAFVYGGLVARLLSMSQISIHYVQLTSCSLALHIPRELVSTFHNMPPLLPCQPS